MFEVNIGGNKPTDTQTNHKDTQSHNTKGGLGINQGTWNEI